MATFNVVQAHVAGLTDDTPDTVNVTSAWDAIEVENLSTTIPLSVQMGDSIEPTLIQPSGSKLFQPVPVRVAGVTGGTGNTSLHRLVITGFGNTYSLTGIAGVNGR